MQYGDNVTFTHQISPYCIRATCLKSRMPQINADNSNSCKASVASMQCNGIEGIITFPSISLHYIEATCLNLLLVKIFCRLPVKAERLLRGFTSHAFLIGACLKVLIHLCKLLDTKLTLKIKLSESTKAEVI